MAGADVVPRHHSSTEEAWCSSRQRDSAAENQQPSRHARVGALLFKATTARRVVIKRMGDLHAGARPPIRAVEQEIEALRAPSAGADAIVTISREPPARKQALGYSDRARRSCVVGTHTNAPIADERVLTARPAFCRHRMSGLRISDGQEPGETSTASGLKIPRGRFEPAMGPATISGLAAGIDDGDRIAPAHKRIADRWCFGTYRARCYGSRV